jgi:hypothetical protein
MCSISIHEVKDYASLKGLPACTLGLQQDWNAVQDVFQLFHNAHRAHQIISYNLPRQHQSQMNRSFEHTKRASCKVMKTYQSVREMLLLRLGLTLGLPLFSNLPRVEELHTQCTRYSSTDHRERQYHGPGE